MKYDVFSQSLFSEDCGWYIGWGIEGWSESGELLTRIEDFSEDRGFTQAVVDTLNREKVERVHLTDVLENILLEPETVC